MEQEWADALKEGKKVEVQQNNVFNVPVQKPSDVTRAIERMNRELARKL